MKTVIIPYSLTTVAGKDLTVQIELQSGPTIDTDRPADEPPYPSTRYSLFGTSCRVNTPTETAPYPHLYVSGSAVTLRVCKAVKQQLGAIIKPQSTIHIRIAPEDYDQLLQFKTDHAAPYEHYRAERKARHDAEAALVPHRQMLVRGHTLGDYSSERIGYVATVRQLTDREKTERDPAHGDPDTAWLIEGTRRSVGDTDTVLRVWERPVTGRVIPAINYRIDNGGTDGVVISADEYEQIVQEDDVARAAADEQARQQKAEREATTRQEAERAQLKRQQTEADELFLWDAGVAYAAAGNQMLHSLGAIFAEKEGTITVYTTGYAPSIPRANTTRQLRDVLAREGFTSTGQSQEWRIDFNAENGEKVIAFLKQHDTKAWPGELGFARCWECGTYSKYLDQDGYCGC